jgi:penicillin-binding protein 1B
MSNRPRTRKRNLSRRRRNKPKSSWLLKAAIPLVLVGGFFAVSYIGYLDYTVREQFEGKRWSIPARVYANPVELYAGLSYSPKEMEDLLLRLHYRQDRQLGGEGAYYLDGSAAYVKTRAFNFGDKQQEQRNLKINFSGRSVAAIVDVSSGAELPILRMEPEQIGSFYPSRKEDRVLIKLEEAPQALLQGLFSTEDRDFYHHFGVSPRGILRAMWANVKAGGMVQGGSTITQQQIGRAHV